MRDAYRTLVMTLRRRLAHRTAVFCTLTPEGEEGQDGGLLRAASGAVLSAYGFGGRYGTPAPEAPLDRVEEALTAMVGAGRPQKLMLGISTRAVDFPVGGGTAEVYPAADVTRRALEAGAPILTDGVGRVPYLAYRREGEERIAFFEDAESLYEKLTLCERLGVGGVALFPCVGVAQSLLSAIAEEYAIVRPYGE
jgi:spore germination protein YaaH